MNEKRNINMILDNSNPGFFSDGVSILNRQDKFFLDFRQNTPRIDLLGEKQQQTNVVKHSTIVIDPIMAKALLNILQDSIKNYEKQHGKLQAPKLQKVKEPEVVKDTSDSYIG